MFILSILRTCLKFNMKNPEVKFFSMDNCSNLYHRNHFTSQVTTQNNNALKNNWPKYVHVYFLLILLI